MSKELQNKILSYEATPPPGVWDKIVAALDESVLSNEFPAKLYDIELMPPASAWEGIKSSLDAEKETSQRKRIAPWIRYAAAAVLIGFVAWGGVQLLRSGGSSGNDQPTAEINNPAKLKPILPPDNTSQPVPDTISDQVRDDVALEASKHTFASLGMSVSNRIKQRTRDYIAQPLELSSLSASLSPQETYQELPCNEISQPSVMHSDKKENLTNRYITLMTPEGNIIRMSKKWSTLLCCVSGDEQDEDCKDQLKKWREKIASSALAPSPANFMDILNLVNSLQDNH